MMADREQSERWRAQSEFRIKISALETEWTFFLPIFSRVKPPSASSPKAHQPENFPDRAS